MSTLIKAVITLDIRTGDLGEGKNDQKIAS